jgi:hypothetical protein
MHGHGSTECEEMVWEREEVCVQRSTVAHGAAKGGGADDLRCAQCEAASIPGLREH